MKKIYIALAFLLQNFLCSAQISFQSGYGDSLKDIGKVVISTSTGGYCIVGPSGQNYTDSSDITIYLTDSIGQLIYSSKIGNVGDEIPTGVVETDDGGFIIVGTTYASPIDTAHTDIFAVKVSNLAGNIVWAKVFGGSNNDEANSIMRTPDGFFLITGSTMSFGSVNKSALALKINDTGDQQWCNINSFGINNYFNKGDITYDNNYILGGGTDTGGVSGNYVVKMDSFGSVMWSRIYSSNGAGWINDIKTTSDSGFVIAGISTLNTAGDTDQNVMKFDSTGNLSWTYNYGTSEYDQSASILETSAHHYVVCGFTTIVSPGSILNQMVLDEIDNTGNIVWANTYGSMAETCEGYCVIPGNDVGYAAVGYSVAFSEPNGDAFLVKTDNNGISGCFELPLVLNRNSTTYTDTSGYIEQSVFLNESADTTMINIEYTNQFSQNCISDNIQTVSINNSVKLFPNPAGNSIQIETGVEKPVVTIFDGLGHIVSHQKLSSQFSTIDVSSLSPGIYIFEIQSDNTIIRNKFIKE